MFRCFPHTWVLPIIHLLKLKTAHMLGQPASQHVFLHDRWAFLCYSDRNNFNSSLASASATALRRTSQHAFEPWKDLAPTAYDFGLRGCLKVLTRSTKSCSGVKQGALFGNLKEMDSKGFSTPQLAKGCYMTSSAWTHFSTQLFLSFYSCLIRIKPQTDSDHLCQIFPAAMSCHFRILQAHVSCQAARHKVANGRVGDDGLCHLKVAILSWSKFAITCCKHSAAELITHMTLLTPKFFHKSQSGSPFCS